MIFFYTYAYAKLYELNFGQALLKLGRFLLIIIGIAVAFSILVAIAGVIFGVLSKSA